MEKKLFYIFVFVTQQSDHLLMIPKAIYLMEETLKDTLINCLSQQISEYELLKSMYPENDEIVLSDFKILDEMYQFMSGSSDYTPAHLDFVLNLFIERMKLEVCIDLPSFYPNEEPDVYVRCNKLNRQQETKLNNELSSYIRENHLGEVCLYSVVSWLQENTEAFANINVNEVKETINYENLSTNANEKFMRYWIYSHHIYNKKKREEIVNNAKDYGLTGFCLPGKPGIICIEGMESNCKEWWRLMKAMTWKKIVIKKTEEFDQADKVKEQKFQYFEELHFQNPSSRHSKHADMSRFSQYMDKKGLIHAFNDFFGLCKDV